MSITYITVNVSRMDYAGVSYIQLFNKIWSTNTTY
jgi:hypothetical protein